MYGWRGILGQIGPSRGDELVFEFYQMAPEGVLIRYSHGAIRQLDRENIERQIARIEEVAIDLDESGVDLIMIGGSPLFTTQGVGSDITTCARIQQKVKVPVTATVTAEIEALRTMGAKKVVLATPFEEWLNQTMKGFLEGSGFEVVNMGGLGIKRNVDLARVPDYSAYRLAKKLYLEADTKADAVFIHCPRWPTINHIELLEMELGCPVVTTSQCVTWHALKLMGIRDDIQGYGALMRTLA
ncbi:MAG: hypothetical protein HYY30_14260 [Chloroflexi bacterium]|nr:hypothetical protein [Chloroflexota bacterium]